MNIVYWLLCVLIALIPAFFVFQKDRKRNIPVKWLPAVFRFLTFFFTAVLLLAPGFSKEKNREEKPILIWLQDNSLSIQHALNKDSTAYQKKVEALFKEWDKDYQVVPMAFGTQLEQDSIFKYHQKSTNIDLGLSQVFEQYQDKNLAVIVLSSDGNFNEGANPIYTKYASLASVYTVGLGDSTRPIDAAVNRIYANKVISLNSTFEVIADLSALKLNGLKTDVSLVHKGKVIAKAPVNINKDQFNTTVRFEVKATELGYQQYSVVLPMIGTEQNLQNNRMDITVEVIESQTKVLIWAASPHPDVFAIKDALADNDQFKVDIKYANEPIDNLKQYNLIIAHQIPAINSGKFPDLSTTPIWYILGSQTNYAEFAQGQNLLKISNVGSANIVLPQLNKNFSLFNLPSNIEEVIAKMPPLEVASGNYQTIGNTQVLFQQKIGAVATNYPLWMLQTGNPSKAILAGTGLWRWRIFEYKNFKQHKVVDELIQQTVRLLSAKKDDRQFKVYMDKYALSDNEPINIFGELRNETGELINEPNASLSVKDSAGKVYNFDFEKEGNRYHANLGLLAPGAYSFSGKVNWTNKKLESNGNFTINAQPLEFLKSYSNFEVLNQIAHQSNAQFFTFSNLDNLGKQVLQDKNKKTIIYSEKTYLQYIDLKWLFFLIFLFAVTEWLLRKYWSV